MHPTVQPEPYTDCGVDGCETTIDIESDDYHSLVNTQSGKIYDVFCDDHDNTDIRGETYVIPDVDITNTTFVWSI